MEFFKHNWATISGTICPEMLIFGEWASWTLFFQNILTNPIISEISFYDVITLAALSHDDFTQYYNSPFGLKSPWLILNNQLAFADFLKNESLLRIIGQRQLVMKN